MPIPSIASVNHASATSAASSAMEGKAEDFATLLKTYVRQMNSEHHQASRDAVALATGAGGDTSQTLLAIKKADLSFQMLLSVRNKLVEAYREVMRMQV